MKFDHSYLDNRFPGAYNKGRVDKVKGKKSNPYHEPIRKDDNQTEWHAYEAAYAVTGKY